MADKLLVTDFDGTMARHDFYSCVVEQLLSPEDLAPWDEYTVGKITHFESLRRIFARIRASEAKLMEVIDRMQFDPQAAESIQELRANGWQIKVVSNGCGWYIERLFRQHGIDVELHTNPGEYSADTGLQMKLPRDSPFFSEEMGVSKTMVVKDAIDGGAFRKIAFAGDGRPDLEPALLVSPELRFARGWLAETLDDKGEPFHSFGPWSEIVPHLCRT